jgi:hypothetical protein
MPTYYGDTITEIPGQLYHLTGATAEPNYWKMKGKNCVPSVRVQYSIYTPQEHNE